MGPSGAEAPPRPDEITTRIGTGFAVQPKKRAVERNFARACINRRLARDVERAATVDPLQIALSKLLSRNTGRCFGSLGCRDYVQSRQRAA